MKINLLVKIFLFITSFQLGIMSSVTEGKGDINQLLYRNALIVGSNTGGKNRTQLRYAVKDAQAFAGVLRNLGGVTKASCVIIENPSNTELINALNNLKLTTEIGVNKRGRKEVLFYYSGHADERGFLLGNEVFSYSTLKSLLNDIKADVRIAVVDACASGSLTREKGGIQRQPFLFDASSQMEGYAYLTSSAQHEPAMESDRIKGSYFTNTLVSGLRGGADFNSDGKVTLNEAYQFSFNETLKKTEQTITGPQHAGYDIRLKGSGDLVLTDLRAGNSGITIAKEITGTIYIRNFSGALVVEVNKQFQKTMSIGLEAGQYEVTIENGNGLYRTKIELIENNKTELSANSLTKVTRVASRSRGVGQNSYVNIPVDLSIIPPMSIGGLRKTNSNFLVGILAARSGRINGTAISSLLNYADDNSNGAIISGISNITGDQGNGVMISGIANVNRGGYGGQISGCSNVSGEFTGIQISGISNVSKEFMGAQISGICNVSGKINKKQSDEIDKRITGVSGAQISGLGNVSSGNVRGTQISGIFNYSKGGQGTQLSGVVNISKGKEKGVQIAGVGNFSFDTVNGAQIGTLNYTKDIKGAQIGVINIGKNTSPLQVGVINISGDTSGIVIGLLSIVKKRIPGLQISVDELGFITGILRSGNTHWCSYLGISTKRDGNQTFIAPVFGVGYRYPVRSSFVGIDYLEREIIKKDGGDWSNNSVNSNTFRLIAGYQLIDHFTIWGGPTLNFMYDTKGSGLHTPAWEYKSKYVNIWLGLACGAEF